jgi:hypothetical protein
MLKQRAQITEPKLEHHKELPLHICKPPWAKAHSPWTNAAMQHGNAAKSKILLTMPRAVRPPSQGGWTAYTTSDCQGRLDRPKRPALHQTAQKLPEPIGTPSKHS